MLVATSVSPTGSPKATPTAILSRAVTKVRACDRAQLVVIAYQTALVSPEEMSGDA